MKKILAIAAVAALTAGVSAYAANPFSDVSTSDWAYQAVSELSDQGIVEGYPDGTFKGQKNMTRYELAQVIARLLAREDQLNAEQRAIVDKLAAQYADELANLGVRVANVEKRLGNVSWGGDARLQYQHQSTNEWTAKAKAKAEDKTEYTSKNTKGNDYNARIRLKANAAVNDQVTVKARLTGKLDFVTGEGAEVKMDQLHVVYAPTENFNLDIGRIGLTLGTATYYDSDFDGVVAGFDMDAVDVHVGYGRHLDFVKDNNEFAFAQANANIADVATVGGFYGQVLKENDLKFWGVNGSVKLGDLVAVDGEYITTTTYAKGADEKVTSNDAKLWSAGLTFGEVDTDKVGSFAVGVHYYDVDKGGYVAGGGLDIDFLPLAEKNGAKFWVAKASIAPMKGVELATYYNFHAKDKTDAGNDLGNAWGVELNYAF